MTTNFAQQIEHRWKTGAEHHPLSLKIANALRTIDNEAHYFNWRFGGDGDNGEELLLHLDVAIENGLIDEDLL